MGNPERELIPDDTAPGRHPVLSTQNFNSTNHGTFQQPPSTVEVFVSKALPNKKLADAYVLGVSLGFLGAHHFYLRRWGFGLLYMFTGGLVGIGWIVDWFRMPMLVREANRKSQFPNEPEKKLLSDAYLTWFPLGLLGFHHYYLHRWSWGIAYTFTIGFFGIGWIVDLFRMPFIVRDANKLIELETQLSVNREPKQKKVCDAYALGVTPLGIFGAHHYYLGNYGFGIAYSLLAGMFGIGWMIDWCRMKVLVDRANKKLREGDSGQKYLDDAYVLLFPFGFLGLHHFYLNRPGWGVLYAFTAGCCGIGWIIDWFRLPCLVQDVNEQIRLNNALIAQQVQDHLGFQGSTTVLVHTAQGHVVTREGGQPMLDPCAHGSALEANRNVPAESSDNRLPSAPHGLILQPPQPPSYEEATSNIDNASKPSLPTSPPSYSSSK